MSDGGDGVIFVVMTNKFFQFSCLFVHSVHTGKGKETLAAAGGSIAHIIRCMLCAAFIFFRFHWYVYEYVHEFVNEKTHAIDGEQKKRRVRIDMCSVYSTHENERKKKDSISEIESEYQLLKLKKDIYVFF